MFRPIRALFGDAATVLTIFVIFNIFASIFKYYFKDLSHTITHWAKNGKILVQKSTYFEFFSSLHSDATPFEKNSKNVDFSLIAAIMMSSKCGKKIQFQMCVWVVALLPQRLKSMF